MNSSSPSITNGGNASVPVTVTDGRGGSLAATVTFAPVNPGPDAVDGSSSMQAGSTLILPLLANDTDPDGDALTITAVSGVTPATLGSAVISADRKSISFTAVAASGIAQLTYTVSDGNGGSDSSTLTLGPVTAVNDAPVDGDEAVAVTEDTPVAGKTVVFTLMTVALLIPGFATALGWIFLLHPRIGMINRWLVSLFDLDGAPFNSSTILGMGIIEGLSLTPVTFIMTSVVVRPSGPPRVIT